MDALATSSIATCSYGHMTRERPLEALRAASLGSLCPSALRLPGGASRPGHEALPSLRIVCKESRIGKAPIAIPNGVTVKLEGQNLSVKGPLGELHREYPSEVLLTQEGNVIKVARSTDTRRAREMHGLFRTLTSNMISGVEKGFEKKMQLIGVGYRAAVDKDTLVLNLGFFNPVRMPIPDGLSVKVEDNTRVTVSGRDKVAVGDFSANIRSWRKPEPYKGKGIRYDGEVVRRKEGKVGKKK